LQPTAVQAVSRYMSPGEQIRKQLSLSSIWIPLRKAPAAISPKSNASPGAPRHYRDLRRARRYYHGLAAPVADEGLGLSLADLDFSLRICIRRSRRTVTC